MTFPHDDRPAFESWVPMGTTPPTWDALVEWQAGRCAVCGEQRARMVEDHDHRTGKSRGILCWSCNVLEGVGVHDVWARWRKVNPASVHDVDRDYPGRSYADDEWTDEDQAQLRAAVRSIPA